jgi:hypothetical protein
MPLAKIETSDKTAQLAAIAKLPRLSCLVLEAVLKAQYAEEGFSDVTADELKVEGATSSTIAGAIGYLAEIQLLSVEITKVNKKNRRFLHATAHTHGYRDEALAMLKARKADIGKGAKKTTKKQAPKSTKAKA